jgi:hypothetical protein
MLTKSIICWWQYFSRLIGGCSQFIPQLVKYVNGSVLFFKKACADLVSRNFNASIIVIEFNFPNSLNVFRRTLYAVFFFTDFKNVKRL